MLRNIGVHTIRFGKDPVRCEGSFVVSLNRIRRLYFKTDNTLTIEYHGNNEQVKLYGVREDMYQKIVKVMSKEDIIYDLSNQIEDDVPKLSCPP